MIAGEIIPALAQPWLAEQNTVRLRIAVPVVSLALAWWLSVSDVTAAVWMALVGYAILHLGLLTLRSHPRLEARPWVVVRTATALDLILSLLVAGGFIVVGGAAYPITAVIGLRVFAGWRRLSLAAVAPLIALLGYLVAVELVRIYPSIHGFGPVINAWFLFAGIGLCGVAAGTNARQRRQIGDLKQALRAERQSREARVGELERTANELRSRMREQHALEEGLRAITSSLSLDEVLHQIVDSTVQTIGRERVSGMALSLQTDGHLSHHAYSRDNNDTHEWAEVLARHAIEQQSPLIVNDAIEKAEFASQGHRLRSAVSVPLFVGQGAARGALTVVSAEPAAFSSSHTRHLAAFAAQAEIAIGNAELHSRMREQQRLLEAVVRDISDGLVVVSDNTEIVLTNPIGGQLLDQQTETGRVYERLLELAEATQNSDQATLVAEIKMIDPQPSEEDGANERFYQAIATRIHQAGDSVLVAIVLHDFTHHRAEERARTEFISMVSHELRNPLHSLNGFLKVVIQGKAGGLTPIQQDFLNMADEQVDLLKGRITELLEFNRMKAGRLTLRPKLNDLSLLVTGTVNRLMLQAEQTGLALSQTNRANLPECLFDSERIGQVVTNLIENAIKATPPGGRISVATQLRNDEVWVSVSDTGVGIAPGDIGKIFKRFYRAHNQKSIYGSHLGLGLAICQQIVEGHGGRIWVESEVGIGSTFTFALPLTPQEVGVAAN
jgi:two-component system, NtrC family, sensor histidine kinase KinB